MPSIITTVFLVLFSIEVAVCRWTLELQVYRYTNPLSANRFRTCCDSDGILDNICTNPCDNIFIFCGRPSRQTSGCEYGQYRTETLPGDDLSFTNNIGNSVSNPLTFHGMHWPANNNLFILVIINDDDGFGQGFNPLIGSLESTLIFSGVTNEVVNMTISSVTNTFSATMQVGLNMRCQEYYYGDRCEVYCQPQDNETGHYVCDSFGRKLCREGYQFNETNCTTPVCSNPVCNINQDCISPNTCICKEGWIGSNCNECIVNCTVTPTNSIIVESTKTSIISTSYLTSAITSLLSSSTPVIIVATSSSPLLQPSVNISSDKGNTATNGSGRSTTNIVIGVTVGLLAMLAIVVLVIITLFALHKRKNNMPKKGQVMEDTHTLDNPTYSSTAHIADSDDQREIYSSDYYLVSHNFGFERTLQNPLYDQPELVGPSTSKQIGMVVQNYSVGLYSLADEIDESTIPRSTDDDYSHLNRDSNLAPKVIDRSYSTIDTSTMYHSVQDHPLYSALQTKSEPKTIKNSSQIFDEGTYI